MESAGIRQPGLREHACALAKLGATVLGIVGAVVLVAGLLWGTVAYVPGIGCLMAALLATSALSSMHEVRPRLALAVAVATCAAIGAALWNFSPHAHEHVIGFNLACLVFGTVGTMLMYPVVACLLWFFGHRSGWGMAWCAVLAATLLLGFVVPDGGLSATLVAALAVTVLPWPRHVLGLWWECRAPRRDAPPAPLRSDRVSAVLLLAVGFVVAGSVIAWIVRGSQEEVDASIVGLAVHAATVFLAFALAPIAGAMVEGYQGFLRSCTMRRA